jgi:hypothetical protein
MNWYKIAEEYTVAPQESFTPEEFKYMIHKDRIALAQSNNLSPQTQQLFFTGEYHGNDDRDDEYKRIVLGYLAENTSITPQTQLLFFAEKYKHKNYVLQYLAQNTSIYPQTQRMFFTGDYWDKDIILQYLARNRSITLATQLLFFTEEYKEKNYVLKHLVENPSFLKGFTSKEMREFTKIKEARLPVYRKRFKDVKAMVLL